MHNYLQEKYGLFIDGSWVDAHRKETFKVINPSTGEELCCCAEASREDVDKAVQAAWKAFQSYKKTSPVERSALLHRIADAMTAQVDKLAMVECLDTGKLYKEAKSDILFAADFYRYCAGAIMTYEGKASVINDTTMSLILREPIGVVGQIVPWNVPFVVGAWKLGPALAVGCTTVVKPSRYASLGMLEFMRCIEDIVPAGVINIVTGSGSRCGQYLLEHPGLRKLSFTGSTEVGRVVGEAAARKIIPVTLELGGKSVNIIFPDSDRDKVKSGLRAFLVNAAQVCSAGSRLFLHEEIYDEILAMAVDLFNSIKVGLPWEEESQMGALCYKGHFEKVMNYVALGLAEGARLACGGTRVTENGLDKGNFMRPTILADVTNEMRVAREEIFGPVLVVIKFRDEEEVIRMANDNSYGLSGAVYTRDLNRAIRVARGVETGRMWINAYGDISTTGVIFGGCKESGIGREGHWLSFDHYTQIKSIVINLAK
ncbi:MAG: aldehyde dehydrogenase family protein [Firmicutes bacterium]|nr:aldehyde dehydrogenase family protein [Bacillota bacterium]